MIYRDLLVNELATFDKSMPLKVISGEYKSQAAFIEHQVVSEFNFDYVQFIECDHKSDVIPVPSLGSIVFVNSKQMVEDFTATYQRDNFLYIGDPRHQGGNSHAWSPVSSTLVFLTTPNRYDDCLRIARALVDMKERDQLLRIRSTPETKAHIRSLGVEMILRSLTGQVV